MRALKHPDIADATLIDPEMALDEQSLWAILGELESNLRNMCLAMDAARQNSFGKPSEDTEKALRLFETFYRYVDDQTDVLTLLCRHLNLVTVGQANGARDYLRKVAACNDFLQEFGDTVAPSNVR